MAGVLAAIYLIALFPLLRANVNYIDDIGRTFSGYTGWEFFSRYLSEFLAPLIHATDFLADISPVTQLIAVVELVGASLIVLRQARGDRPWSLWDLAAAVPLGLSPYFLECLSYKYDSPYMALSVLASVAPLMLRKRHALCYGAAVVAGMVAMCTTYQAASGIFPMAVLMIALLDWLRGEEPRRALGFVARSAVAYVIGIGIFFVFMMNPVGSESYVSNGIASVPAMIGNFWEYGELLVSDAKTGWLVVTGALCVWFVASAALRGTRPRLIAAAVAVATVLAMLLLAMGLYPALASPLFAPRAMYGIGVFVAFVGIGCMSEGPARWITRLLTIVLMWSLVTFSAAYGNAMAVQHDWEDFRRAEILNDLTDLPAFNTDEPKTIQIEGNVGRAQRIVNMTGGQGIMNRLVPVTLGGGWMWGYSELFNGYGLRNVSYDLSDQVESWDDFPLLQESAYHAIYGKDNRFIVVLK